MQFAPSRDPQPIDWLERERRIPIDVATKFGVTTVNGNLAFEFFRNGELQYRKVRLTTETGDKSFRRDRKDAVSCLFNEPCLDDEIDKDSVLIFTEGEIDCLSFLAIGCPFVVSVPDGAQLSKRGEGDINPDEDRAFDWLWSGAKLRPEIAKFQRFLLATDDDDKGRVLRDELAIRLGRDKCWHIRFPEGCKDANEVLVKYDADALIDAFAAIEPIVPDRLVPFSSIPEAGVRDAYRSGWLGLDEHLRLVPPELVVVTGKPGSGKALALNTEVATPYGWTTMGEIKVGDVVYDERGLPCNVVRVSEIMLGRPCYRMRFSDGTEIIADADHQWFTSTDAARKSALKKSRRGDGPLKPKGSDQSHKRVRPGVVMTKEIAATIHRADGGLNHAIELTEPVQGVPSLLPVEPYTLGCWLGDGRSLDGGIVLCEQEMRDNLIAVGAELTEWGDQKTCNVINLKAGLRVLNVIGNKHIPRIYLRASVKDRIALLQGLMDTDGHCSTHRECEFVSINAELARGVHELICSLGIKATLATGEAKLYGRVISDKYRIHFTTGRHAVFRLARKQVRQGVGVRNRMDRRYIAACDPIPSVPVRCIQVDSPSRLFLVTRAFVPTHNSQWTLAWVANLAKNYHLKGAILQFEDNVERNRLDLMRYALNKDNNGAQAIVPGDPARDTIAKAWMDHYFRTIAPSEDLDLSVDYSLAWLQDAISEAATRHGCKWVLIDPWNELEHIWSRSENEAKYTNDALRALKRMARRFQIAIIVVTHPSKEGGKQIEIEDMTLYDVAGAAAWKNKADHGIIIHRNMELKFTYVKIDKSKNHALMGVPGVVKMRFSVGRGTYEFVEKGV